MYSDTLSWIHFWTWQIMIVSVVITFLMGINTSKEYAEHEWPIDILITISWVIFGINMFGTIAKRRVRHLYVAIWFYMGTWLAVAMLHIFNNLEVPLSFTTWKSYSIYAGAKDALVQWWYGHNAVAFVLTTPVLGLMYYFLPKAADRPVFSYKLSIIHFWSLIFVYLWAGPHHLPIHCASGLGTGGGNRFLHHADRSILGRNAERIINIKRSLGQSKRKSYLKILRCCGNMLRYGNL
ncbi:cbb3-type cytochrome c oxidase subunit I [Exiguobacterium sp. SL14]|nr:cbb3-type cytochrome c oxidase subunit I [Exiguobacterium sp. SL14]